MYCVIKCRVRGNQPRVKMQICVTRLAVVTYEPNTLQPPVEPQICVTGPQGVKA
jgi:hypothetical protein